MKFTYESFRVKLECTFDSHQVQCEGIVNNKYTFLRFPVGCEIRLKFGHKYTTGIILKYTKSKAVIKVSETQQKTISINDLVTHNAFTQICIRIEKDGLGPYQQKNVGQEVKNWQDKVRARNLERQLTQDSPDDFRCPTPQMDRSLRHYPALPEKAQFGFSDFTQLFEWFHLEEVLILIRDGFKIVTCQKGLDYYESIFSYNQMAMIKTKEDHDFVINNPLREW